MDKKLSGAINQIWALLRLVCLFFVVYSVIGNQEAPYNQLIASGLRCLQNYKHWQQPQRRRGTMFTQECGMIVIQLLAYDLFFKAKNQMTHVRRLLLKPQACSAYLIFRRNQGDM